MRTKVAAFSRLEFLCNQEKSLIFKKGKADRRSKHAFHYFLKKTNFSYHCPVYTYLSKSELRNSTLYSFEDGKSGSDRAKRI